jgi:cyclopropane fatty-acyl-phospholipid synthase-like methyltransferase
MTAKSMVGVNAYHRALGDAEIAAGAHREVVGGLWDEIGELQSRFLIAHGLRPDHALVDIGCGALRGGVHFVRYLQRGRYHGLDINPTLITAGELELQRANLSDRDARLLVDGDFDLSRFGRTFDYGIAVSVFTHLFLNHIARCLRQMRAVMHEDSRFFCTFFEAPSPVHLEPILHSPGRALTRYDADPFHYAFSELEWLARQCGLRAELIGSWDHPRDQRMVCFTRASS